jgi:hypothetical protein
MPRPRLHPTDEQRKRVKSLAALGLTQAEIAGMMDIRSTKTLRKYFRRELDRVDLEGYAKVRQTHFHMATDGKHWLATKAWQDSYHRRHGQDPDQGGRVSPPEKREVSRIVWRKAEQLKKELPPVGDDHPPAAASTCDSSTANEGERQEAGPETALATQDSEAPDDQQLQTETTLQAPNGREPDED